MEHLPALVRALQTQLLLKSPAPVSLLAFFLTNSPLVKTCIWETRWLHGWMNLQTPSNWIIVETEREVLESVFYRLTDIFKNFFLDPDRKVVDQHNSDKLIFDQIAIFLTRLKIEFNLNE